MRDDLFTVVFDQVMTDTALYADVVLPATTFLEGYDFAKAYGPINLELVRPVVDAVGEARSNADVFGDLPRASACSTTGEPTGELDLLVRVLDGLPGSIGADLRSGASPDPPFGSAPVQFVDVFPNTPDGRIDLFPAGLDADAPAGSMRISPIRRPSSTRSRSSRPPATGQSARRSASCRAPT